MKINSITQYQPNFQRKPKNFLVNNTARIESMLESNASVKDIADAFGTDIQTVYRYFRIKNIKPPKRSKKEQADNVNKVLLSNIKLFIDKTLTIDAIAQITKCTVKEINNWLTSHEHKIKSLLRLEMFKSGMSPREVAKACGISIERAFQIKRGFQKENLLPKHEHEKVVESIQNDIRAGVRTKDIAKKHNLSESSVYRYKKRGGITDDDICDARKKLMISMIQEGLGIRDMARQMGVSEQVIKDGLKKYNLKGFMQEIREKIEDMILNDAQNGEFLETLAHKYGYSKRTISYKINRAKERIAKNQKV